MVGQLLDNIQRYLNARCTLKDLEAWVLSNLQRILDSGDEVAIRVANEVDADLVELGEGLIDEVTLRQHLESYVSSMQTMPFVFQDIEPANTVHATAAVETIRNRAEVPGSVVDLHLVYRFV